MEFGKPKVIWPDIARSMRFCWDVEGNFCGNTAYFSPALPKWSVAVLNSSVLEFIVCQLTNSIRGGFVRLFTDYTSQLPILEPDGMLQQKLEEAVDSEDIGEASRLTSQLYGLSLADEQLIAEWFAKRSLGGQTEGGEELLEDADE